MAFQTIGIATRMKPDDGTLMRILGKANGVWVTVFGDCSCNDWSLDDGAGADEEGICFQGWKRGALRLSTEFRQVLVVL